MRQQKYEKEVERMQITLTEKPKSPVIIDGFPGFGLVGTIATEFLIEHLKMRNIGNIWFEEMQPMVAVHNGELVHPLGLFHNEEHNIVILHAMTPSQGQEWRIGEALVQVAKTLGAKEIISLEGVGSADPAMDESKKVKTYFYSTDSKKSKELERIGLTQLKDGIIIGVTASLVLKTQLPLTCIFAETHSQLPDSKAAAHIIEALDKFIGLNVDYEPLLKTAQKFEQQIKGLLQKTQDAVELQNEKKMSYVG